MDEEIDIIEMAGICKLASIAMLEIYESDFEVNYKSDKSPVTKADEASNQIVCAYLEEKFPHIPIISEENKNLEYHIRKHWKQCWLLDPLDGTKEFIKKNGEFTINIALIENNKPVFGMIYIPISGIYYYAFKQKGAYKFEHDVLIPLAGGLGLVKDIDELYNSNWDQVTLNIIGSRSHLNSETEQFVEMLNRNNANTEFITAGSALKFCLLAEGKADIYPRFAPTMEWDTAAGQIILEESGKKLYNLTTKEVMVYNRESLVNEWFVGF